MTFTFLLFLAVLLCITGFVYFISNASLVILFGSMAVIFFVFLGAQLRLWS